MFLLNDVNELYDAFSNKVAAPGNLDKKDQGIDRDRLFGDG